MTDRLSYKLDDQGAGAEGAGFEALHSERRLDDEELSIVMCVLTNEARALYLGSIGLMPDVMAAGFSPALLFHRMQKHENDDHYTDRYVIDSAIRQTLLPLEFVKRSTSVLPHLAALQPTERGLYTGLYAGHTLDFSLRHDMSMQEIFGAPRLMKKADSDDDSEDSKYHPSNQLKALYILSQILARGGALTSSSELAEGIDLLDVSKTTDYIKRFGKAGIVTPMLEANGKRMFAMADEYQLTVIQELVDIFAGAALLDVNLLESGQRKMQTILSNPDSVRSLLELNHEATGQAHRRDHIDYKAGLLLLLQQGPHNTGQISEYFGKEPNRVSRVLNDFYIDGFVSPTKVGRKTSWALVNS